jgi:hypothetical protein
VPHAAVHPETQGLDRRTDLIDPHAGIPDAAKVPHHNWVTMVVDREVVGEEVAVEGTLPTEGVTRTIGLMMILGVATTPTARTVPVTMGEILGTNPSWRHGPPRVIPVTWWHPLRSNTESSRLQTSQVLCSEHWEIWRWDRLEVLAGKLPTRHEATSALDTFFMIQYLLIYLTDFARNRLNNLREGMVKRWADLEKAFYNHFEGLTLS